MDDTEKAISIGALLTNMKVDVRDPRSCNERGSYSYRIGESSMCATFFRFIYGVTKKQIQRYQTCIKTGDAFEDKRGGNDSIEFEQYEMCKSFLNNYLRD